MSIRWLLATLCALCACQPKDVTQIVGTVERDRIELVAEAHEPIAEVLVREGDHVTVGQPLLRQVSGALAPRIEQAQALLDQAEQQWRELHNGPRVQQITQARAAFIASQSTLQQARRDYDRALTLQQAQVQSQALFDQARTALASAQSAHDQAQAQLQLLQAGTRPEQLAQASAARAAALANLNELKLSATRYELTATRAGVVEAIPYRQGERPPVGAPLIALLADGRLYARVYVPEPLRAHYRPGVTVQLHVDGRQQPYRGVVRFVSAQAAFTPYYALTQHDRSRLSYLAEIDVVDVADTDAPPVGLPVEVTTPAHP